MKGYSPDKIFCIVTFTVFTACSEMKQELNTNQAIVIIDTNVAPKLYYPMIFVGGFIEHFGR